MNSYSLPEITLLIIGGGLFSYFARTLLYKHGLGPFILFCIIILILVHIARLIYYKGNLPPKNPYIRKKPLDFINPVSIVIAITGITSLILLNTLYR